MKKLMIAAAAAAVAGGAFAHNIFDYKASVKYVDFKTVNAKTDDGVKEKIYLKVVKSAKLTGYLVTPVDCPCEAWCPTANGPCERAGIAPSFLVIQNKAARKYDRMNSYVKLMPANLLTEWWTTKSLQSVTKKTTLQAQGYLFAGVGKRDVPDPEESPFYGLGDFDIPTRRTAATQFLFGQFNMKDEQTFIEPFLDQAGFGKAVFNYSVDKGDGHPCIWSEDVPSGSICLTSLSGHLIGGSFACLLNGQYVSANGALLDAWYKGWGAEAWICQGWDDHTENALSVNGENNLQQDFAQSTRYMYNVVCGTWSIKANNKIASSGNQFIDIETVGKRLDRNFSTATFDDVVSAKDAAHKLGEFAGNFVEKWF